LPELTKTDRDKAKKIDGQLETLPEAKLIDIMIETKIEKKCG
jgi:lysyl-tRNA synthetase class 2